MESPAAPDSTSGSWMSSGPLGMKFFRYLLPLAPGLLQEFGTAIAQDRVKQMIGHMVGQIMSALGYIPAQDGVRITSPNLFTRGTRYYKPRHWFRHEERPITPNRHEWIEESAVTPFNRWLDDEIRRWPDGRYDQKRLSQLADRYGIADQSETCMETPRHQFHDLR
jgi:hypothetical protein